MLACVGLSDACACQTKHEARLGKTGAKMIRGMSSIFDALYFLPILTPRHATISRLVVRVVVCGLCGVSQCVALHGFGVLKRRRGRHLPITASSILLHTMRRAHIVYVNVHVNTSGMVLDLAPCGSVENGRGHFENLHQWSTAVKGRSVPVMPVVYYLGKHLRQHEREWELERWSEDGGRNVSQDLADIGARANLSGLLQRLRQGDMSRCQGKVLSQVSLKGCHDTHELQVALSASNSGGEGSTAVAPTQKEWAGGKRRGAFASER